MSELVLLHHNEPMTTSLAIADGVEMTHHSVLVLVKKHAEHLAKLGPCEFQIHVVDRPQGGGANREVFFLNEQQATLLITFMRNSEIVIKFKVALVKAFFELRDRAVKAPQFTTRQLDHGADLAVAADRTFRGFLRSARAAGMRLPAALRVANAQTVARTGLNMLDELGVDADAAESGITLAQPNPLHEALSQWEANAGNGPWRMDDILFAAFGVRQNQPEYNSLRVRVGKALSAFGIRGRKINNATGQFRQWERRKF